MILKFVRVANDLKEIVAIIVFIRIRDGIVMRSRHRTILFSSSRFPLSTLI